MASTTSFAQTELKNGVYEFISTADHFDHFVTQTLRSSSGRTLIVENDTVLYIIGNSERFNAVVTGTRGNYFLKIEKYADSLYKAKNEDIELIIKVINRNDIEVEIISGRITYYYSGGQYLKYIEDLPPEKQTLTFVRNLTAEDEEKLLNK